MRSIRKTPWKRLAVKLMVACIAAAAIKLEAQQSPSLLKTFVSTVPEAQEFFGSAVAGLGPDRVLIGSYADSGAEDAGAAYLFSTNGLLLTTLRNPVPGRYDNFGSAVAVVSMDKLLVGSPGSDTEGADAGVAYLFRTNGALVTTLRNPSPSPGEFFGCSVSAVGSNAVVIGAYGDRIRGTNTGAAYLFNTDGKLVTVFTDPSGAAFDFFGFAVAAVGERHVLIGAYGRDDTEFDAGIAYLFNTNGSLVGTFRNPSLARTAHFGSAVAAVGAEMVLIGAYAADQGAVDAGAAYLFSTNGTLLTTFTNPAPGNADHFGGAVAAVGTDKVLVGADADDSRFFDTGSAYLFNLEGALLATFTNPTPAYWDFFGCALAAVGTDKVIIGAYSDTGLFYGDSGAAYLFSTASTEIPRLRIERLGDNRVRISWGINSTGALLEQAENASLESPTNIWRQISFPYVTNLSEISVTVTATGNGFYRMRRP